MPDPLIALLVASALGLATAGLLWPDWGLLDRWRSWRHRSARVLREDALKHLHNCQMAGRSPSVEEMAGAVGISSERAVELLDELDARDLIRHRGRQIELTSTGLRSSRHIVRAHRLLERYLAEETGYDATEWHTQAERLEHELTAGQADQLSAELGHPTHDPHGDPIPTSAGEVVGHRGTALTEAALGTFLQIVHLEDEPESVYAQLVAEGLHVGQQLQVLGRDARRIRFWAGGDEHVLAPIVANNIAVVQVEVERDRLMAGARRLSELPAGAGGRVIALSPACRGAERRRLLDLGLLPGTQIGVELVSPGGDPRAYRLRGALIALREEQADWIWIDGDGATTE